MSSLRRFTRTLTGALVVTAFAAPAPPPARSTTAPLRVRPDRDPHDRRGIRRRLRRDRRRWRGCRPPAHRGRRCGRVAPAPSRPSRPLNGDAQTDALRAYQRGTVAGRAPRSIRVCFDQLEQVLHRPVAHPQLRSHRAITYARLPSPQPLGSPRADPHGGLRSMHRRGLEPPPGYPGAGPQPGDPTVISVDCVPDRPHRPVLRTIRTHRTIWMLPRMLPEPAPLGVAWRTALDETFRRRLRIRRRHVRLPTHTDAAAPGVRVHDAAGNT